MDARYDGFGGISDSLPGTGDTGASMSPAPGIAEVAGLRPDDPAGKHAAARIFVVRPAATKAQLRSAIDRIAGARGIAPWLLYLDGAAPASDVPSRVLGRCHNVSKIMPASMSDWIVDMLKADRDVAAMLHPDAPCRALTATFRVRCLEDVELCCNIVSRLLALEITASIALRELVLNGVEHGNLGITFEEKSKLLESGDWLHEVNRRLAMAEYRQRFVTMDVRFDGTQTEIRVADQGRGFDWRKYVSAENAPSAARHGRGISMAVGSDFDSIEYQGDGSAVLLRLNRAG